MFHVITAAVALFVAVRVIYLLPWTRALRIMLAVFVLLVSQHHLASRLIYGTMFSPEAPRAVMIAVNWLFGTIVLAFAMRLLADVMSICVAVIRRRWQMPPAGLNYVILIGSLSFAAVGVAQLDRTLLT